MMSAANAVKLDQQGKIQRGELLGHIDLAWARRRYIDESAEIGALATEMGISVIYARRFLQAHGIHRDRGHIYRTGAKPKARKGIRVPGSIRDLARLKARAGSSEHREKQAAAKRGKFGPLANNWKGGIWIAGDYEMTNVDGRRAYVHRVVAETLLGRSLLSDEQVHHVDFNRRNNAPENLIVLFAEDHARLHSAITALDIKSANKQRLWLLFSDIQHEDLARYA